MPYSYNAAVNRLQELKKCAPFLTFDARFGTFPKKAVFEKLARAGFISINAKTAKCPFCLLEVKSTCDEAFEIHKYSAPSCAFVNNPNEDSWTIHDATNLAMRCASMNLYEEMVEIVKFLEGDVSNLKITREEATRKILKFRKASHLLSSYHRQETFENFPLDKLKKATCNSKTLSRAGFFCTSEQSVKCPFCLLELEFEATDDPWVEHQKYGRRCDFVELKKLDESEWTLEESVRLGAVCDVKSKFEKGIWLIEDMDNEKKVDELSMQLSNLMAC